MQAGDVYEDLVGCRIIVNAGEDEAIVLWEPFSDAPGNLLSLPKWLFAEGRCGQLVSAVETTR